MKVGKRENRTNDKIENENFAKWENPKKFIGKLSKLEMIFF